MSKLIHCKSCQKEMASDAKACPSCGSPNKKNGGCLKIIGWGILGIIVIGIISSAGSKSGDSSSTSSSTSSSSSTSASTSTSTPNPVPLKVGSIIKTPKFEIQVSSVNTADQLGGEFFESKPADGGTYLAIQWNYKNISDSPISAFSQPSLHLKDPKGTKYDADTGASASYATELKLNEKVMSDLNPGIRVKGAEVFEVSKELLAQPGWKIYIDADKDLEIPVN